MIYIHTILCWFLVNEHNAQLTFLLGFHSVTERKRKKCCPWRLLQKSISFHAVQSHSLFSLYFLPTGVMFVDWLCRWCIIYSDSFPSISTQPYAGCYSLSLCFQFGPISRHIILLTSSSVYNGCINVYLIIFSCYWPAMTSPSYPSTKKCTVPESIEALTLCKLDTIERHVVCLL